MDEIKACIIQTFGELKTKLTESDLERIMNTKMITANRAEELVKPETDGDAEEEEEYIKVTSLFSRVDNTEPSAESIVVKGTDVSTEEMKKRSNALRGADQLSDQLSIVAKKWMCLFESVESPCPLIRRNVLWSSSEEYHPLDKVLNGEDNYCFSNMETTALVCTPICRASRVVLWIFGVDLAGILLTEIVHQIRAWRYSFAGKHVMITGGSSGLGLEMAKQIASESATVTIVARNRAQLEKAKDEIVSYCRSKGVMTPLIEIQQADICNKEEIQKAINESSQTSGSVDVIICNAGMAKTGCVVCLVCYAQICLWSNNSRL